MFIIIGILILISVSAAAYIYLSKNRETLSKTISNADSPGEKKIEIFLEDCLEATTLEAINKYGMKAREIEEFINYNMPACTKDLDAFKKQGFDIRYGKLESHAEVNSSFVYVRLDFPIMIKRGSSEYRKDFFEYHLDTLSTIASPGGLITARKTLYSKDENFIITVEEDTKVTDNNGNPVSSISIRMSDNEFNEENSLIIGSLIYTGIPEGIRFDPPLKVKMRVPKSKISGMEPGAPKIAWLENDTGLLKTYSATAYLEDSEYFYFTALVDHFTPIMLADCGSDFNNEHFEEISYKQLIDPYYIEFWHSSGESYFLVPELLGISRCDYDEDYRYDFLEEYSLENPESVCNIDSKIIYRDWDEDDNPENSKFSSHSYHFYDTEMNRIYAIYNIENAKERCYNACSEYASAYLKQYFNGEDYGFDAMPLPEKFRFDPAPFISGDGISDNAPISCILEGDKNSLVLVPESYTCAISENNIIYGEPIDTSKIGQYDGDSYLNEIELSYKDLEKINITMQTEGVKFFATPKTPGYERVYKANLGPGFADGAGYLRFFVPEGSCIIYDAADASISSMEGNKIGSFSPENKKFKDTLSCSQGDECIWSLNNGGKITKGENIVSVEVSNAEGGIATSANAAGYFYFAGKLNS